VAFKASAVVFNPFRSIMGCLFSFLTHGFFANVDDARAVSKKIDKDILMELKNEPDEIDILILGAPESGKSTLLKQVYATYIYITFL
jgi:ribosome biogenesis GTPase A